MKKLLVCMFAVGCVDQLPAVEDVTNAKAAICRVAKAQSSSDPNVARAQEACAKDEDLRKIAAAYAGDMCHE